MLHVIRLIFVHRIVLFNEFLYIITLRNIRIRTYHTQLEQYELPRGTNNLHQILPFAILPRNMMKPTKFLNNVMTISKCLQGKGYEKSIQHVPVACSRYK